MLWNSSFLATSTNIWVLMFLLFHFLKLAIELLWIVELCCEFFIMLWLILHCSSYMLLSNWFLCLIWYVASFLMQGLLHVPHVVGKAWLNEVIMCKSVVCKYLVFGFTAGWMLQVCCRSNVFLQFLYFVFLSLMCMIVEGYCNVLC